MIGLLGCAGSMAVIGWIPYLLLWLVVRMQTPHSAAWFGGEDTDPMLLGEVTDTSPPGSGRPAAGLTFGYCLLCLYNISLLHCGGPREMFLYTGSSFIKYK